MFALLANGAPAPFPTSGTPAVEVAVWGACVSVAVLLGGWGLRNRNRPKRDTAVGVCLLTAMIFVGFATLFALWRNHDRQMERNQQEREAQDRGSTR